MASLTASLLTCLACCVSADSVFQYFDQFVHAHGRAYKAGSAEYAERRAAYDKRVARAEEQNSRQDRLWTAGVNEYWDWTDSEVKSLLGWKGGAQLLSSSGGQLRQSHSLSLASPARPSKLTRLRRARDQLRSKRDDPAANHNSTAADSSAYPLEKNWLHLKSALTYRNQGYCGSCWALAAAGILEAASEIHGKRRTFSVQEMVSCVPNPHHCGGTGGCEGSTVELAMDWVMHQGLAQEHEIPYKQKNGLCNFGRHTAANAAPAIGMTGWETLPQNKYLPLMDALVKHGPVAVSASADDWLFYVDGVYNGCQKDVIVNHAVVLYGYGQVENKGGVRPTKYWTIQNSWGRAWGENGFIRILRRDDDEKYWCGIDRDPQMGTGCAGGPPHVTVCGMCGILYDSVVAYFD